MRVILVSYHFPPDPAVGSLRPQSVAAALAAQGHTVVVVTARLPGETGEWRTRADGIRVRIVQPLPGPRELWAQIKSRRRTTGSTSETVAATEGDVARRSVPTWKRYLYSFIWLPDDRQGFIPPAAWAASMLVREGVDLIYTSAPPFSTHLVGLLLRTFRGIRWVAEFRDPWTDNPWKPDAFKSAASLSIERWLESRTLALAARTVSVTDGIHRQLSAKVSPSARSRFLVVRNGIQRVLPPRAEGPAPQPFRILYIGTFYLNRDPTPFLQALARVRRRHDLGPQQLAVTFVGHCRQFDERRIDREVSDLGLDDVVSFRDWVPHDTALELIRESDLLLLLARGQPTQVPNKLYEYLGTRIPILASVDENGESAVMLREIGGHYVMEAEEPALIERAIEQAMTLAPGRPGTPDEALLEEWRTSVQMQRLLSAIET
ncbi:MAG: glycosyltransferase family 4 protein [Gemmatimonadota bacterium]